MWLARVGRERIEEVIDPELTIEWALETYAKKGYSREWINQRLQAIQVIRVHDGAATAIAGTYDENTHVFTFETDEFSTYALAYKDPVSSITYKALYDLFRFVMSCCKASFSVFIILSFSL